MTAAGTAPADFDQFDPDLDDDIAEARRLSRTAPPWISGALSGGAAGLAAHQLPWPMIVLTVILGIGAGFLGHVDWRTKLILNSHNAVLSAGVLSALITIQLVSPHNPVVITAALTAAGTFGVMVLMWWLTGFAAGGDIKIAPVIAGGLAALSPLTACMWLLFTFLLCAVVSVAVVIRAHGEQKPTVPLAPFMALAIPPAVLVYTAMFSAFGLLG
ncbi:hypothetical protein [Leifsonia sp. Leaf264]|uniref:hypothetical protein n=1 Tax=Leifsonia sp. Leaf264 TaxID=1736314 RepID=UPI0006FC3329|nr:hypothetical protein [Leifsonia sp. Leaf264]KQO98902.1 hypothetical protein ASF30_12635 [Leifsonia sp. Leaf264]